LLKKFHGKWKENKKEILKQARSLRKPQMSLMKSRSRKTWRRIYKIITSQKFLIPKTEDNLYDWSVIVHNVGKMMHANDDK